ncbi:unnamed protein product, partial [Mesorhabditis belari]|uniref:C-type lectin domain-containing protein n=1 Tax=Mesorhabditis belari TaxID=2138241 RepID=A0AAF3F1H6_9BILA
MLSISSAVFLLIGSIHSLAPCTKCPAKGIFSKWKDSTSCTKTCGLYGSKMQKRTCTSMGFGCPCNGPLTRKVPCPDSLCDFPENTCAAGYKKIKNEADGIYYCGEVVLPTDDKATPCKLTHQFTTKKSTTKKPTTKRPTTKKPTTRKPTTKKPPSGCVSHNPIKYANCAAVGNGFTNIGGSCYKVVVVNGNRAAAIAACKNAHANANLGTIRCKAENTGTYQLSQDIAVNDCSNVDYGDNYLFQMWIGLNNENDPNGVSWVNGGNSTYRNWSPNEPNNGDLQGAEPSTQMYINWFMDSTNEIVAGAWNDYSPAATTCAALCEVLTKTSGKTCGALPC